MTAERDALAAEVASLAPRLRVERLRALTLAREQRRSRLGRILARRAAALARLGLPSPLFDEAWYRRQDPGVPAGALRAWRHWKRVGWRAGHDPNPLFDVTWYLDRYRAVRASSLDPLTHYTLHGVNEGHDPGPHFDAMAYLERYPDARASGLDPLLHYLLYGAAEGRQLHP